ncbi:hypothetical protein F5Y04DRAFT_45822 [Hypomontagnella monticulosa]|nr:hypothetical protein F5Y04DRAFT_45822 [Hypomontagnella monticulosa]
MKYFKSVCAVLLTLAMNQAAAQTQEDIFKSMLPWKALNCSHPLANDESVDPGKRWTELYADAAWNALKQEWKKDNYGQKSGLNFTNFASSKFFGGPPGMSCGYQSVDTGCEGTRVECNDDDAPGGILILNSFMAVNQIFKNVYGALSGVSDSIDADMGVFSSTFAAIPDNNKDLKMLTNILAMGLSVFLSPVWNTILKPKFPAVGGVDKFGAVKDASNAMISSTVTMIKDGSLSSAAQNALNSLSSVFGETIDLWSTSIESASTDLLRITDDAAFERLSVWIDEGRALSIDPQLSNTELKKQIKRAIYPSLIAEAWRLRSTKTNAWVANTGHLCTYPYERAPLRLPSGWEKAGTCIDGKWYQLLSTNGDDQRCWQSSKNTHFYICNQIAVPPGLDSIKSGRWGELTVDDLIRSAVTGYHLSGDKNTKEAYVPSTKDDIAKMGTNSIQNSGVMHIPVCSYQEGIHNMEKGDGKQANPNYPCN